MDEVFPVETEGNFLFKQMKRVGQINFNPLVVGTVEVIVRVVDPG